MPGAAAVLDDLRLAGNQYPTPRDGGGRMADGPIVITALYDDTLLTGSDAALVGLPQNGVFLMSLKGGAALGKVFGAVVNTTKYVRTPAPELLTRVTGELTITGPVEEPVTLRTLSLLDPLVTGNTDATSLDGGASSVLGGSGYMEVTSLILDGATSITGTIRHSTDNITFAVLATFTAVTAHPASQRLTVATGVTINRYLSAGYILTGAGSGGEEATFTIAFQRNA